MRARARPLFLRTIFKSGKEGNPRTDISALKSVSDFAFDYKSEIRILNLSSKYKFITLPWTRRISRLYFRRSLGSGFVFPRVGGLKSVGIVVIEPQPTFLIDCSDFTSHRLRYNNRLQETQARVFLVCPLILYILWLSTRRWRSVPEI